MDEQIVWQGPGGSTITRLKDAASIIGPELAEEIEARAREEQQGMAAMAMVIKNQTGANEMSNLRQMIRRSVGLDGGPVRQQVRPDLEASAQAERAREQRLVEQMNTRAIHGVRTQRFHELPRSRVREVVRHSVGLPTAQDPIPEDSGQQRPPGGKSIQTPNLRASIEDAVDRAVGTSIRAVWSKLQQIERAQAQQQRQVQRPMQKGQAQPIPTGPVLIGRSICEVTGQPVETWQITTDAGTMVVRRYGGSMAQAGNYIAGLKDNPPQPAPSVIGRHERHPMGY